MSFTIGYGSSVGTSLPTSEVYGRRQVGTRRRTSGAYRARIAASRRAKRRGTGGAAADQGPIEVSAIEDLFDETGLPTRLPKNAREAMLFQLQASRSARQLQARQTAAALSSVRYGLGMTARQSPYGLGALMSPLISQMAGIQERVQYAPSDFSYFVRPDAFGEGEQVAGAAAPVRRRRGPIIGGPARLVPSRMGMSFQPEPAQQQPVAAPSVPTFALPTVPPPTLVDLGPSYSEPSLADAGLGDEEPL